MNKTTSGANMSQGFGKTGGAFNQTATSGMTNPASLKSKLTTLEVKQIFGMFIEIHLDCRI